LDAGDAFFASAILANQNADGDKLQAKGLLQGYEKIGCDALNVGGFDLAAGKEFLMSLSEGSSIPFISANLTDTNDNLLFPAQVIIERSGFKIGVTGFSDLIPQHIDDVKKRPYVESVNKVIAEMKSAVDYVVLLANVERKKVNGLVANFPDADYIFISRDTQRTRPTIKQVDGGPYVYSTSINQRLEKLQKKDPVRTIEEMYADKPNVLKLISDYRQQLVKYETIMADAINTTQYESIPLSKAVGEDAELLAFVDETLATCSALRKKNIKLSKNIIKPKSGPLKKTISIN